MATKAKQTAEEMRQAALAMLRKAKARELEEKKQKFYNLGILINRYVDGEITGKEMKSEVKKITGKEFTDGKETATINSTP